MVTLATILGYITAAEDLYANIAKVIEAAKASGDPIPADVLAALDDAQAANTRLHALANS